MDNDPFVSNVNKVDTVLVLLFGVAVGVLNEFVSWFFIYRKENFKKTFAELCDSYEVYVNSQVVPPSKSSLLTGETPGKLLLNKSKKLKGNKTFSTFLTGLLLMGLMPAVMSMFEYSVVAKLPFKPFNFLTLFTHSKLLGSDPTDCTATAVYTLSSMLARQYTKAFLGYFPFFTFFFSFESPLTPFRESMLNEESKR